MYIAGFAGCQFCLLVTSETAARWKKIDRSRFRPNRNARPHRHRITSLKLLKEKPQRRSGSAGAFSAGHHRARGSVVQL
jgi:hypothetical protein